MAKAASGANSSVKTLGISLFIDDITKAEPFASLFSIKPETKDAIKRDMEENGFDPSKPVNVWKTATGSRILIDGYTRVAAAEELGLQRVQAYEKTFIDEAEALGYALHCQRNRRNLSDGELLHVVEAVDARKTPGRKSGASAPDLSCGRSADHTAMAVGTSPDKVKKIRVILSDAGETVAVKRGQKTINHAWKDMRASLDFHGPKFA
jgi:hypothetical protein